MPYVILVSVLTSLATFVGGYYYLPLSTLDGLPKERSFGSTITTINGSDTLSSSRTVINTNFANLNTDKLEQSNYFSTTTHNNITTLSALTSVGTIATGVWSATAIGVGVGGTGTTSPTQHQVMLGNGSSGLKVAGWGTSGQLLTSNGPGVAPTFQSASFDTGANYTLTGAWTFNTATTTIAATSTIASSTPMYGYSFLVGKKSLLWGGVAIGMASTTISDGTLVVAGLASSTNLTTSNTCSGCLIKGGVASSSLAYASDTMSAVNGVGTTAVAACPAGTIAIAGGVQSADVTHVIIESRPISLGTQWQGTVVCSTGIGACGTGQMTVYATCVKP